MPRAMGLGGWEALEAEKADALHPPYKGRCWLWQADLASPEHTLRAGRPWAVPGDRLPDLRAQNGYHWPVSLGRKLRPQQGQ